MNLLIIFLSLIAVAALTVFILTKTGKIEDKDGNNIPDAVEEKVKETKARVKRVKEEAADVVVAVKEAVKQVKDVAEAAKGEKRKGRKSNK
jgi:hypothetical protein